ncbi:MAG: KpsF/GutQ family sugar-phosphate isomerase [Kiritimatiellae bacterium]|nr:KpsF/GutQ family sugar-phosphate isomerase [Kiritimatiellia bacterium]
MDKNDMLKRAREVFDIEIEGLRRTRDSLGESFTRAVELMLKTIRGNGIIVVTGIGKNLAVAEKMSAIFASTGTRSICLNPVQAMHGDLGMVAPRDVLVALSFSGESEEVLRLIPAIRRHGLKVISLTGREDSSLAKMSDVHVPVPCGREACPFGMAPTNSTTATMAMGDAMAMVMIDAMKFDIASYAMNHPAGAIGRALVLKATDVMRKGEDIAAIPPETTVMDALLAMTKAKAGAAVVTDSEGRLLGIFTDGDFRRLMAAGASVPPADLLSAPVADVMTKHPMFVKDDTYASELLKVFEKRRIDDLPICDSTGRVAGLVDINDLPKMKVL